jgi:hypothetical protein
MSKSDRPDAAALFEKVTGQTEIVEEQKDTVSHDTVTDEDEAFFEKARQDGLDEAVAEPDVDSTE